MNTLNRKLMLGMALVATMAFSTDAFAAAKTRTALQTDLDNNKETQYNVHTYHADQTTMNDSAFNLTTDDLDDIPDGATNKLIPAADATFLGDLEADGVTVAELGLLDGSLEANTAASVAAILDTNKALQTDANVGTAGTGVTAVEYGDGFNHVTVLTITAAALAPTTVPADAEGIGVIIYTFPAGVYAGSGIHVDLTAFTGTGLAATNAVDFGFGSLIASGDIATLSTAAMEDWLTGQTIADISSPATEKSTIMTGGADLLFESAGSHVLNLNMAGTWNDTFTDPLATATVTIYWTFLGT